MKHIAHIGVVDFGHQLHAAIAAAQVSVNDIVLINVQEEKNKAFLREPIPITKVDLPELPTLAALNKPTNYIDGKTLPRKKRKR